MSKNTRNRILLTAVAALLLVAVTVGGTMAWLTADSDTVMNTFTTTSLDVEIDETPTDEENDTWVQPLLPGQTYDKDPFVKLTAGSVDAWVFVEIIETNNTFSDDSKKVSYTVGSDWVQVKNGENAVTTTTTGSVGIWMYKKEALDTSDTVYLLSGGSDGHGAVIVSGNVTQDDMVTDSMPKLTFKAYALQSANLTLADGTLITTDTAASKAYEMWQLVGAN